MVVYCYYLEFRRIEILKIINCVYLLIRSNILDRIFKSFVYDIFIYLKLVFMIVSNLENYFSGVICYN